MESIYTFLNSPNFDITQFKTDNESTNTKLEDVLNESTNLNNEMSETVRKSEKELNKYKSILGVKDENLQKNMNHIQWNYYYYKKYKRMNEILRYYVGVCIGLIILSKLQSPYFDNLSYSLITGTIIAFLFIYIMYSLWDLYTRDNINFDEYDFSRYGNGLKTNYNPNDRLIEFTVPRKSTYDFSGCSFYSNSRNTASSRTSSTTSSTTSPVTPVTSSTSASVTSSPITSYNSASITSSPS